MTNNVYVHFRIYKSTMSSQEQVWILLVPKEGSELIKY